MSTSQRRTRPGSLRAGSSTKVDTERGAAAVLDRSLCPEAGGHVGTQEIGGRILDISLYSPARLLHPAHRSAGVQLRDDVRPVLAAEWSSGGWAGGCLLSDRSATEGP